MLSRIHRRRIALAILLLPVAAAVADPRIDLSSEAARSETVRLLRAQEATDRAVALEAAQSFGWVTSGTTPDGRFFEMQRIGADGIPRFYITDNSSAAISTAANLVRNTAPYNVNGSGVVAGVGIWDGGDVRPTHQEFGSRVSDEDASTGNSGHATHVAGTIGASGVNTTARGMAPGVFLFTHDFNNDESEMSLLGMSTASQTDKVPISNHSYGFITGWSFGNYSGNNAWHFWGNNVNADQDARFGKYSTDARDWDSIAFNAPYYLIFKSAGNDRFEGPSTGNTVYHRVNGTGSWISIVYNSSTHAPLDGLSDDGYDTIGETGVPKNIMTVGSVADAVSGSLRSPANGVMSSYSCWGPTDDGRIKPDIVANGEGVFSTNSTSNTAYTTLSGTSMATPNATGSAALLVELYRTRLAVQPRAATLKALILNTATDIGNPGPDFQNGWGLMDTKSAADIILAQESNPSRPYITEASLASAAAVNTHSFFADGTKPLRLTIVWTDPPGTADTSTTIDPTTRRLVNDLDMVLEGPGGTPTFNPFIMNPADPVAFATTGDNDLDNVEQISIAAPGVAGTYTVRVRFEGATMQNAPQRYSLVINNVDAPAGVEDWQELNR